MAITATVYPTMSSGWTNSDLANAADSLRANATSTDAFNATLGDYVQVPTPNLFCRNFTGLSSGVNPGDTINGITVEASISTSKSTTIGTMYLARGGAIVGISKSFTVSGTVTLGGVSDLWGGSWTGADLANLQVIFFGTLTSGGSSPANVQCDYIRVRATYTASTPNAFTLIDETGATTSTQYTSNVVTVSGLGGGTAVVSVSGTGATYEKNSSGVFTSSAGTAVDGDSFRVRVTSSPSHLTAVSGTLTIGGVSDTYTVTTGAGTPDPDAFGWSEQDGADLNAVIYSNTITLSGLVGPSTLSISNGQYSVNNSAYTASSGTVFNGDRVTLRATASSSYLVGVTVTVTVGSTPGTFVVTTRAARTDPAAFSFTDQASATASTLYTSNAITVSGIEATAVLSFTTSGGTGHQYKIDSGSWINVGTTTINNGQTLTLRATSDSGAGNTANITATIGNVSGAYTIVNTGSDGVPAAFSFTDVASSVPGVLNTSNTITLSGMTAAQNVAAVCVGGEMQINSGSWVTSGNVVNGDTVKVRAYASNIAGGVVSVTLTIGDVSDTYSITTRNAPILMDF